MTESNVTSPTNSKRPKRENLVVNLICNIALPTAALSWLSKDEYLGALWGLVLALVFPIAYGIYDLAVRRKTNTISIIGFVSVLATGGLGLMQLDGFWFAVKEAAVPFLIGLVVLGSMRGKNSIVREILLNEQVLDVEKIYAALEARKTRPEFETLMIRASSLLAVGFIVSSALNFGLARVIIKSAPATPAFNDELGRMNLLSWPVIVLPSFLLMMYALWYLMKGLQTLSGLPLDDLFHPQEEKKG